jgi:hypothetical protein
MALQCTTNGGRARKDRGPKRENSGRIEAQKKEEFPGIMENMRLGNSFPRSALFLK